MSVKPAPWVVSRAAVDPVYQGLWRDLKILVPYSPGAAAAPVDLMRLADPANVNSPAETVGPYGLGLSYASASSQYTDLNEQSFGLEILQWSCTFVVRTTTTNTQYLTGVFNDGDNQSTQVELNRDSSDSTSTSGSLRVFQRLTNSTSLSAATDTDTGFNDGEIHVLTWLIDHTNAELRVFVDGVEFAVTYQFQTAADTSAVAWDADMPLAARYNSGIGGHYDGDLFLAGFHGRILTDAEVHALHADPFGLIRPAPLSLDPASLDPHVFFDITDLPADFGNAETATITVRTRGVDIGATPLKLYAQLFQSDETTSLSDEVEVASHASSSSFANSSPITFTGLNTTAAKSVWDNARVRFRWGT